MPPSRHYFDPLKPSPEPRWLQVCDHCSQQVSFRRLDPGTDLRATLDAERQRYEAEGWDVEWPVGRYASGFFMSRARVRWHVSITWIEPASIGRGVRGCAY
jgi:hypothetical protein